MMIGSLFRFLGFGFLVLLFSTQIAFADAFRKDLDGAIDALTPMLTESGIVQGKREEALKIAGGLLKKYPKQDGAHHLNALVLMAANQGDKAIEHAEKACNMNAMHCETAKKWVEEISADFQWCIDDFSMADECEMTQNSGKVLTKIMKDMFFTNRDSVQHVIGRFISMDKGIVSLNVTWASKTSGLKKGINRFPLSQLMKLRESQVSEQAKLDGWQ